MIFHILRSHCSLLAIIVSRNNGIGSCLGCVGAGGQHCESDLKPLFRLIGIHAVDLASVLSDDAKMYLLGEENFGLIVHQLISDRVVLANGTAIAVSNEEHRDLFWVIREAGHNFVSLNAWRLPTLRSALEIFSDLPPEFRESFILLEAWALNGVTGVAENSTAYLDRGGRLLISPILLYSADAGLVCTAHKSGKDQRSAGIG
ncbi:hypothetical protein CC78DRAFT_620080 [Lojkania enalia]|uniref:Uncharacterized protein n=1 Tax=Lojkania enalia TaxID=147567 RepID=A0A9P4MZV0_9PLEO|nr:hypothetical protein CC78DRAFT_620080 [Didymosphaeria enalia]